MKQKRILKYFGYSICVDVIMNVTPWLVKGLGLQGGWDGNLAGYTFQVVKSRWEGIARGGGREGW